MTRVTIVPRPLVAMLGVLSLFALVGLFSGAMLIAFSSRIAATATGSRAFAIVVGIGFLIAGLRLAVWAVGQWRAVRAIDVADDGGWTLHDNLGRTFALPATTDAAVELLAYEVVVWRPLPQKLRQTAGRIVAGDRTWRLATNARSTYQRVLGELALDGELPSDGLARYERPRAA